MSKSNVGLGIKSAVGLKTFMEEWNGHNAFVHPLKFDDLFNKVIFVHFYNELKFHILSRDGKMLGLPPGIKILISSKIGHSTFVLSTMSMTSIFCLFNGAN